MPVDPEVFQRNAIQRERLHALVNRASDADLARPLSDGWTAAAVLAHLALWDQRALFLLNRWEKQGHGPSPVDVEALNEGAKPLLLALPPRAAAQAVLSAADALDAKIELLSAALFAALAEASPMTLDRTNHRRAHLDEIEQVLGMQSGER